MEEEYENYVRQHKASPSIEWVGKVYNTEEFEWEDGFEPWNLSEVVAIDRNGAQAFHVGDADIEIDTALDMALYGCYEHSQDDTDKEDYLAMAERLDFTEDSLPDTIYKSENYIFAFL